MCGGSVTVNIVPATITALSLVLSMAAVMVGATGSASLGQRVAAGFIGLAILQVPAFLLGVCGPDPVNHLLTIPGAVMIGMARGKTLDGIRSVVIGLLTVVTMLSAPDSIK